MSVRHQKGGATTSIMIDPCAKYGNNSEREIIHACGNLLGWAVEGNRSKSIIECMKAAYPWWMETDPEFVVGDSGVMAYAGDPPIYPYVKVLRELVSVDDGEKIEEMWIYPSAWVRFVSADGRQTIVRMD